MSAAVVTLIGHNEVFYRPELESATGQSLEQAVNECRPDVIVADAQPDLVALRAWRQLMPGMSLLLVVKVRHSAQVKPVTELGADLSLHLVFPEGPDADLDVLRHAERMFNRHVTSAVSRTIVATRQGRSKRDESVVVVGAGIVGLMTAIHLLHEGYHVRLIDARPDPRSAADWRSLGCTSGGGNARMFSLTEADNYNDQGGSGPATPHLRTPVVERGWRICSKDSLDAAEEQWIYRHECLAPWLARAYNEDIFSFNRESRYLWDELRGRMPQLFSQVEIRDNILRIYTERAQLEWSATRHQAIGSLQERLEPSAVGQRYPALKDACNSGTIVGALEVVGFTLNVHDLVRQILNTLEDAGVIPSWNTSVRKVIRPDHAAVEGLLTDSGLIQCDHYVLSPGVYGHEMLEGTASDDVIHGVAGVWMTLPNLAPKLQKSIKITRKGHAAEDANVTVAKDEVGQDVLVYGSGYGYTGRRPDNILPEQLDALYAAVEDNIRTFFPKAHAAATESGLLPTSRRICVRPWTPTGLGVFEILPATTGLLIITGGHNTGGFAQSPSVAKAVVSALQGRPHPMHEFYHPWRGSGTRAFPSERTFRVWWVHHHGERPW